MSIIKYITMSTKILFPRTASYQLFHRTAEYFKTMHLYLYTCTKLIVCPQEQTSSPGTDILIIRK